MAMQLDTDIIDVDRYVQEFTPFLIQLGLQLFPNKRQLALAVYGKKASSQSRLIKFERSIGERKKKTIKLKDLCHFSESFGLTVSELLAKYEKKDISRKKIQYTFEEIRAALIVFLQIEGVKEFGTISELCRNIFPHIKNKDSRFYNIRNFRTQGNIKDFTLLDIIYMSQAFNGSPSDLIARIEEKYIQKN